MDISLGARTRDNVKLADVLLKIQNEVDERCRGIEMPVVMTGLEDLDRLLGGLHAGEVFVLAAATSVGKTAFAGHVIRNIAGTGATSLIFALEMDAMQLGKRWLSAEAGISGDILRYGYVAPNIAAKVVTAAANLSPLPIWINDDPTQKIHQILTSARRLKARENLQLVVIDYLQLITAEEGNNRNEQVASMSRGAKLIAREMKIPVMLLSQINRESVRAGKAPRLCDLRDSGAIEQDADTVVILHRPNEKDNRAPTEQIEAIVAKQRNGPCDTITLTFIKETQKFEVFRRNLL
jgi:replicative DNA helicase